MAPLADAFVRIRPDTTGFQAAMRAKLGSMVEQLHIRPVIDLKLWLPQWENFKRRYFGPHRIEIRPNLDPTAFRARWRVFENVYLQNRQIQIRPDLDAARFLATLSRVSSGSDREGRRSGGLFSDGFLKVVKQQFQRGAAAGLLGGSALTSLLPIIGQLVVASGALAAALPAALVAGGAAAGALKLAMVGVGDAIKEAFSADDPKKLAAALAQLSPAARGFVLELAAFRPQLVGLQQAVQQSFFAPLQGGFRLLIQSPALGILRATLTGVAEDAGKAARGVLDIVTASAKSGQLAAIFAPVRAELAGIFAQAPGLTGAFLKLAEVGSRFASILIKDVGFGLGDLIGRIDQAAKDGSLQRLFENGMQILGDFGNLLKSVGSIIASVFQGLSAGGASALGTIGTVTSALAAFLKTAEGAAILATVGEALRTVGEIIRSVLEPLLPVAGRLLSAVLVPLAAAVERLAPLIGRLADQFAAILGPIIATLAPVFEKLVTILADFLVAALGAVSTHIDAMLPVLNQLLNALGPSLIPVVDSFGKVLMSLIPILPEISRLILAWMPILIDLIPVFQFLAQVVTAVMTAIAWAITNLVLPVLTAMVNASIGLKTWVVSSVTEISNRWSAFATFFRDNIWNTWLGPTIALIMAAFTRFKDTVVSILSTITSTATSWWNALRNNVLNPLMTMVQGPLVAAFGKAADGIGATFGRVTGIVRNVVNGTITVINGVINAFNTVAKAVGIGGISTIGQVGAPATGGGGGGVPRFTKDGGPVGLAPFVEPVRRAAGGPAGAFPYNFAGKSRPGMLSGPGGGRDDRVPLWASAGEFVVNAVSSRMWRPVLEWINNRKGRGASPPGPERLSAAGRPHAHRDGGVVGLAPQRLATGGIVGFLEDAWNAFANPAKWVGDKVAGLLGRIPGAGMVHDIGVGMGKKAIAGLVKWITDKFASFGAGVSGPGFPPWPSSPSAVRYDSGVWRSIVAMIRATGPISGTFGNAYRPGDPLWHGSGRAVDWMGFGQDALATFLASKRPLELIHRTARRDYAYTRGVNKGSFNNTLMEQHRNHVHIAMKLGGLVKSLMARLRSGGLVPEASRGLPMRVMDTGGKIRYGEAGLNLNRTPEVMTPGDDMREAIEVLREVVELLAGLRRDTRGIAPDLGRALGNAGSGLLRSARTA